MKYFITVLLLFCLFTTASAQLSLKGYVQDDHGGFLQGASVKVRSGSFTRASLTDAQGYFAFQELPQGDYTLTITNVGFEDHSQRIVLVERSVEDLRIVLAIRSKQLQSVEIIGRSARKYNSDYSFSATKIAALNKDIPQSITAITKELMSDRQAFQLADAVKVASGVIPSSYYNQYAIRGISQNEEGQIVNGMRTRQYYFLQPLTSNIERVEVIKGPASASFASVDPGGSINLVTKKPLSVSRKEISLTAGSFSTIRGTLDFTGPLNESKTLLYRINAAYQDARSFRDFVGNKSLLISPSFSYIPNDRTAVNVEMIYSNMNGNLDRGQPIFGAVAGQTDLKSTPVSLNLSAPNDFFKSREMIVTANVAHHFSSWLTFNTSYMKQTWSEDLQEHRTTNAFAVDLGNNPVTSLAGMQFIQRKQFWSVDNVSSYFNADFNTGKIKHKLVFGYDLNSWEKTKGGGQNAARGFLLKDGTVANTYIPANQSNYQTITAGGVVLPRPNVNYFDLNNPVYTIRNTDDYSFNVRTVLPAALTTNHAVYIQEQLQWNRFTILLGLRQEWFKDITNYNSVNESSFTNKALLPRAGLTYALTKDVNLYGTYLEGFQPQSNTVTLMPNTGNFYNTPKSAAIFDALTSDLKEAGVKASLLKNKIQVNAAWYIINQRNILMNANLPAYPDSLVTRGADRSKGFELEVAGFVLPNWQVNLSYSYIDARIKRDAKSELVGLRKENTPFNSGNFWTRYNFISNSSLKGFGAGLGLQYSGDKVPWFTRAFKVPSYTLLDLALYYTPGKGDMQLALNVNNVLDKTYWIGAQNYQRLFPGAPRNILLTATYKF
ncbi:TonB-dependent receptor [Terrimonas sp. NA20]|uniref:TonB-dependent receptor n=1 Tax=Terrimonas ginsenosidimutans TaxID=2908004 RepID=A0ABS9KT19_9BACT|nr:TonB-dependent receptor [Terrimonas ginsenosidimutans]MCG2615481.1 TonB-dependent receptor [Terrimonas ginsenosidimutans]